MTPRRRIVAGVALLAIFGGALLLDFGSRKIGQFAGVAVGVLLIMGGVIVVAGRRRRRDSQAPKKRSYKRS